MNYIEIADGLSVRMCEIEAVSRKDEFTSTVHTHHNTYDSTFPYMVLLQLLESNKEEESKETNESKEMQRQELNIFKQIGTFAG